MALDAPFVAEALAAAALPCALLSLRWNWLTRTAMSRAMVIARALAAGDLEQRANVQTRNAPGADLLLAVNDMADHLDAFIREAAAAMDAVRFNRYYRRILPHGMNGALLRSALVINDATEAIQLRVQSFEQSTDDFAKTMGHIVDALVGSARDMSMASTRLKDGAGATEVRAREAASSSRDASGSVRVVSDAADHLSQSARSIGSEIERSAAMARAAVQRAEETGATIAGLSDAVGRIGSVVGLIDKIASQTNLLALNATIEASRAGEAGRGFAVVAAEVKTLASQTAAATQDIARQIDELTRATHAAIDSIRGIGSTIGQMDATAQTVRFSVESQIEATTGIADNVSTAATGTETVAERISGISTIASETASLAEGLMATSDSLSREGSRLTDTVQDFLARLRSGPLDRRKSNGRVATGHEVVIHMAGRCIDAVCIELSMAGGSYRCDTEGLAIGDRLQVAGDPKIRIPACVRWVKDDTVGLEFVASELTLTMTERLAGLTRQLAAA